MADDRCSAENGRYDKLHHWSLSEKLRRIAASQMLPRAKIGKHEILTLKTNTPSRYYRFASERSSHNRSDQRKGIQLRNPPITGDPLLTLRMIGVNERSSARCSLADCVGFDHQVWGRGGVHTGPLAGARRIALRNAHCVWRISASPAHDHHSTGALYGTKTTAVNRVTIAIYPCGSE